MQELLLDEPRRDGLPRRRRSIGSRLGIGLALSRRLVELHGGTIEARSGGTDQGSEFHVKLPLGVDEAAASEPGPASRNAVVASARRRRVLIVDDNLDAGDSLAMRLELAGHEARLARDGVTGLAIAREFRPDVAFLDIGMPGMNGYELARAIRESRRCDGTLIVALTGWGARRDIERARMAGFDAHLTKPAPEGEVEALLARAAGGPPT